MRRVMVVMELKGDDSHPFLPILHSSLEIARPGSHKGKPKKRSGPADRPSNEKATEVGRLSKLTVIR